ncbi:MAG: mismatch repair protein Vsr [Paenibacillus sp.]|jgi:DNA mismatch endonuclease (patch repair protein)|nr:mismatch repair protein Vsr [Paenibacillus sp.]
MSAIRSTHTKIEDRVSKALWRHGFRFRKNVKALKGKPDIVIQKYKIVIFIDSCFWHGCPVHGRLPKSNIDFWANKLERNRSRDWEITNYYKNKGWNVMRVWEHDLKADFQKTILSMVEFITCVINFNKK